MWHISPKNAAGEIQTVFRIFFFYFDNKTSIHPIAYSMFVCRTLLFVCVGCLVIFLCFNAVWTTKGMILCVCAFFRWKFRIPETLLSQQLWIDLTSICGSYSNLKFEFFDCSTKTMISKSTEHYMCATTQSVVKKRFILPINFLYATTDEPHFIFV